MCFKKEKWSYGLIGFGCGIIAAGLFMTYTALTIQEIPRIMREEMSKEIVLGTPKQESSQLEPENLALGESNSDEVKENSSEILGEHQIDEVRVILPRTASATQICNILEKQGVVESAVVFKDYIREQEKTTKLLTGDLVFPKNASIEEVLDILLGEKNKF